MTTLTTPTTGLWARRDTSRTLTLQLGLWMFLGTVTMLFAAFTSAYLVRRAGMDWHRMVLPTVLWLNTALLATSSVALEIGRRATERRQWQVARSGVWGAALLGIGFLVGQVLAWRELVAQGVYIPTSPHSSFFFLLTGVHAVHLVAGLLVLAVGAWRLSPAHVRREATRTVGYTRLAATCWHFFGALWVYLFFLLSRF